MASGPLPIGITPRGLTRDQAAAYLGLTPRQFNARVRDGHVPGPIPGSRIWDRAAIDARLDAAAGLARRSAPSATAEDAYEAWKARRAS